MREESKREYERIMARYGRKDSEMGTEHKAGTWCRDHASGHALSLVSRKGDENFRGFSDWLYSSMYLMHRLQVSIEIQP